MAQKILVLAAFPPGSAGGSWPIMEQLLRDHPKEKLFWWFLGDLRQSHSPNYCLACQLGPIPWFLGPGKLFRKFRLFLFHLIVEPLAVVQIIGFINRIKPDAVIAIPYGLTIPIILKVFRYLKKKTTEREISLHVSIHDMADTENSVALLGKNKASQFQKALEEIFQLADSRDCVTKEMGKELQRVTGAGPDLIIMYGAEEEEIEVIRQRRAKPRTTSIAIGYAGTIIATEAFLLFLEAVRLLNRDDPDRVRIHLFTSHPYQDCSWFDSELIVHEGFLSGDDFRIRYNAMDFALCLMPLDGSDHRYTGFSIPCKLTKSMAMGLPVLCLAGRDTTAYRILERYCAGFYSDASDPKRLAAELNKFFLSNNPEGHFNRQMASLLDSECHAGRNRRSLMELFSLNESLIY
jgi:hypothetical protein